MGEYVLECACAAKSYFKIPEGFPFGLETDLEAVL